MDQSQSKKVSLWRETFSQVWRYRQQLWVWFLLAFIVYASSYVLQIGKGMFDPIGAPTHKSPFSTALLFTLPAYVLTYCIAIVYFKMNPITTPPKAAVGNFFTVMGYRLLTLLIVFIPLMVVLTLIVVIFAFSLPAMPHLDRGSLAQAFHDMGGLRVTALALVSVVLYVVGLFFLFYMSLKYLLVMPLAVNRMQPVFKTSWHMTAGNWWRLFGHLFMVMLVSGLPFFVFLFIVRKMIANAGGAASLQPVQQWSMGAVLGILAAFMYVSLIIYECVACRSLCEEKRQSDPGFLLAAGASPMSPKRA